jgi:PAS domain S-box-containing protein
MIEVGIEAGEVIVILRNTSDKEGIQTYCSDQWIDITGYSKEELLGMSFFDLVSIKHRKTLIEMYRKKMSGIRMPGLFEINILRKMV